MKAAVSRIVPAAMRSTGFGIFETGFGIAWFLTTCSRLLPKAESGYVSRRMGEKYKGAF